MMENQFAVNKEVISEQNPERKSYCPFIKEPFDNCYILKQGSQYYSPMILYCGGNYEGCEIYKKNIKGK